MAGYLYWTRGTDAVDRVDVETTPVTIGRAEVCGIQVAEGASVHAIVEPYSDGFRARRLSRTVPMTVNDEDTEEAALENGDVLGFGGSRVTFVQADELASAVLVGGFEREDAPGRVEMDLLGTETVIGRRQGHVLIDDDSVSRTHLAIENFGEGLRWVRDLDSTNGSSLNDAPLVGRRVFVPGDKLQAGRIVIDVAEGGTPPVGLAAVPQHTVVFPEDSVSA